MLSGASRPTLKISNFSHFLKLFLYFSQMSSHMSLKCRRCTFRIIIFVDFLSTLLEIFQIFLKSCPVPPRTSRRLSLGGERLWEKKLNNWPIFGTRQWLKSYKKSISEARCENNSRSYWLRQWKTFAETKTGILWHVASREGTFPAWQIRKNIFIIRGRNKKYERGNKNVAFFLAIDSYWVGIEEILKTMFLGWVFFQE